MTPVLQLCRQFEMLVQSQAPSVFMHMMRLGVQPLKIAFPWLMFGFSGTLDVCEVEQHATRHASHITRHMSHVTPGATTVGSRYCIRLPASHSSACRCRVRVQVPDNLLLIVRHHHIPLQIQSHPGLQQRGNDQRSVRGPHTHQVCCAIKLINTHTHTHQKLTDRSRIWKCDAMQVCAAYAVVYFWGLCRAIDVKCDGWVVIVSIISYINIEAFETVRPNG